LLPPEAISLAKDVFKPPPEGQSRSASPFLRFLSWLTTPFAHLQSRLSDESVKSKFETFEGKPLDLPTDGIPPEAEFLAKHREKFKIG